MSKKSAGILAWKIEDELKVFIVHPGGPFFAKKDAGVWTIPKGEFEVGEEPLAAAQREFAEEVGQPVDGVFEPLGDVRLKSGKTVYAWAVKPVADVVFAGSNTFSMEWPLRSGRMKEFPEVDRAAWVTLAKAKEMLNPAQLTFLDRLVLIIAEKTGN